MTLQIGDRFTVVSTQEIRNAKSALLARYLPQFNYAVTARNLSFVLQLEAAGLAQRAEPSSASPGLALDSGSAKTRGTVSAKKGSE